jgi:hypothetical protein
MVKTALGGAMRGRAWCVACGVWRCMLTCGGACCMPTRIQHRRAEIDDLPIDRAVAELDAVNERKAKLVDKATSWAVLGWRLRLLLLLSASLAVATSWLFSECSDRQS